MNDETKVVYVRGNGSLETVLDKDNKCIYSGTDYTGSKAIMPLKEAIKCIDEDNKNTYSTPWKLITEEHYDEMLNTLPPRKWNIDEGVEMFAMSEFMTGSYTSHYATYKGKYYTTIRDIFSNRIELVNELKFQIKNNEIIVEEECVI